MVRTFNPDRVPTRPLVLSASVACQALPPPFAALAGELCDGNPSQVPTTALDVTALRAHLYDDTTLHERTVPQLTFYDRSPSRRLAASFKHVARHATREMRLLPAEWLKHTRPLNPSRSIVLKWQLSEAHHPCRESSDGCVSWSASGCRVLGPL